MFALHFLSYQPPVYQRPTKLEFPCDSDDVMQPIPISQSVQADNVAGAGGAAICNAWRPASLPALHMSLCAPVLWRVLDVSAAAAVWSGGILLCGCAARFGVGHLATPQCLPAAKKKICRCSQFSPPLFQKCLPVLLCIEKKNQKEHVLMFLLQCS